MSREDFLTVRLAERSEELAAAKAEVARLSAIVHRPISSTEFKLVDKNCDWNAFRHAWNAIMKSRSAINP